MYNYHCESHGSSSQDSIIIHTRCSHSHNLSLRARVHDAIYKFQSFGGTCVCQDTKTIWPPFVKPILIKLDRKKLIKLNINKYNPKYTFVIVFFNSFSQRKKGCLMITMSVLREKSFQITFSVVVFLLNFDFRSVVIRNVGFDFTSKRKCKNFVINLTSV